MFSFGLQGSDAWHFAPHFPSDFMNDVLRPTCMVAPSNARCSGTPNHVKSHEAVVEQRVTDEDGVPVGKEHNNPFVCAQAHWVEFIDDNTETLTANIIPENALAQVDEDGNYQLFLDEIADHQSNGNAISKHDGFIISNNSENDYQRLGIVCHLEDGSTDWITSKDIGASHPLEVHKPH